MSYIRPDGDAVEFAHPGYSPSTDIIADFPAGTYTPPDPVAAAFGAEYTRPAGDDIVFDFGSGFVTITGTGAGTVGVVGAGEGTFTPLADPEGTGAGTIGVEGSGAGTHGARGDGAGYIEAAGVASGAHGVRGSGEASTGLETTAAGAHGVRGSGAGSLGVSSAAAALHLRYELKGEVREAGALVNRTVRAYTRVDGELYAEVSTTLGRFAIHAGFAADTEFYLIPINLNPDATDWAPPCANRVVAELAMDDA